MGAGALAALSLAEDRLGAGAGDRRDLGFGAAAAGPMPAPPSSSNNGDLTVVEQQTAELAPVALQAMQQPVRASQEE